MKNKFWLLRKILNNKFRHVYPKIVRENYFTYKRKIVKLEGRSPVDCRPPQETPTAQDARMIPVLYHKSPSFPRGSSILYICLILLLIIYKSSSVSTLQHRRVLTFMRLLFSKGFSLTCYTKLHPPNLRVKLTMDFDW